MNGGLSVATFDPGYSVLSGKIHRASTDGLPSSSGSRHFPDYDVMAQAVCSVKELSV